MLKLALTRSGGFGGISQRFAVDEGGLAPKAGAELRRLVDGAAPWSLPAGLAGPAAAPDRFTYRLTVEDGARRRELRFTEQAMTDALAELVRWLEARG
jgi:hypothetical protein